MNLEIMQMKMNNIADKLDELYSDARYSASYCDTERDLYCAISDVYRNISYIIKEEMKITHY